MLENGHSFKESRRHFVLPTDPLDSTLNPKNRIVGSSLFGGNVLFQCEMVFWNEIISTYYKNI